MQALMLNADFSQRCVVDSTNLAWQSSPSPLVHRRMLERLGGEVARATSVVRYEPGASFESHRHDLGEEILVLDGILGDEHGTYGPGTFIKNPPGTRHSPFSREGCTLLVIDTRSAGWYQGMVDGLRVLPLAEHGTSHTAMVRWAPETYFNPHRHFGGEEIFVLEGVFSDEYGDYPQGCWIRSPHLSQHKPFSVPGCLILVRTGHLPA